LGRDPRLHEAWIRFARTGNAGWVAYGVDHLVVDDPAGDERVVWEGVTLRT
jgi:hypothetical protein